MTESLSLRPYQSRGVDSVFALRGEGVRSVCGVAPTGAGKTVIATACLERAEGPALFLAHTQEIILQTAKRFAAHFGPANVGVVMGQEPLSPIAPIQVASIQTLLARDFWPAADFIIQDEAHHYIADDWSKFIDHYPKTFRLGLTATPQRGDGRPLGDQFERLVVFASYSELIADGFLVKSKAYQPPEIMVKGLAADPLKAWQRYAPGQRTFGFANSVKNAEKFTKAFKDAGIPCATVEANTRKTERKHILSLFGKGDITVVWSVNALTEGVDVPAASCAIIAKSFAKVGQYMQAGGRILRPAPGKELATIIDLTGATLIHGLPTEDREYSLDGEGIKRTAEAPLKNCLSCGATILSAYPVCPECDYVFPKSTPQEIKIWSYELREVFAGQATETGAKLVEWKRLLEHSNVRDWSVSWAVKEYRKLFNEAPDMSAVTEERRFKEWISLQKLGAMKGFKPGFTFARYKAVFGEAPKREWKPLPRHQLGAF